ncbi:hypothetical protein [Kineosporia babensis]|nr:hypothetical protein [Kineosporia babensis]
MAALQSSAPLSSEKARATFGWSTSGPSLLEEFRSDSYQAPQS